MLYLYRFSQYSQPNAQGTLVAEWAQTSYEDQVYVADHDLTYEPTAITHGEVSYSGEQVSGTLTLRVARDHPVAVKFLPGYPSSSVYLRVFEMDDPSDTPQVVWRGRIRACEFDQLTASLTCTNGLEKLGRLALSITHPTTCQWELYGTRCGVNQATYTRTGTISAISTDGLTLTTTLSEVNNWFKAGLVEVNGQLRTCIGNTGGALLLNAPFFGISVGDGVSAAKGCDKSSSATSGCKSFSNYTHFSGDELPDPKNYFATGL
jgi:hypothetical protein